MESEVQIGTFTATIKPIEIIIKNEGGTSKIHSLFFSKRQSEALPYSMFDVGRSMFDVGFSPEFFIPSI